MKRIPSIKSVMTPFPYSIDVDGEVRDALDMMAEHGIRHLPVKRGADLVSIVSERDVRIALGPEDPPPGTRVREVAVREAYVVDLNDRLDYVLEEMAARQIGSAVVVKEGRLAGIFTTTDACAAFARFLRGEFPTGGDEAA